MTEMNRDTMYAVLREIKSVAMEASLTGAFRKAAPVLVQTYNRCLEIVEQQGDTEVKSLFPTLAADTASVDEVGVAAALLSGYIRPVQVERPRRHDDEEDED